MSAGIRNFFAGAVTASIAVGGMWLIDEDNEHQEAYESQLMQQMYNLGSYSFGDPSAHYKCFVKTGEQYVYVLNERPDYLAVLFRVATDTPYTSQTPNIEELGRVDEYVSLPCDVATDPDDSIFTYDQVQDMTSDQVQPLIQKMWDMRYELSGSYGDLTRVMYKTTYDGGQFPFFGP